jgi:hypothetical protein
MQIMGRMYTHWDTALSAAYRTKIAKGEVGEADILLKDWRDVED